nr:probable WRKY transcription factor 19 [Quercus suber]
MHDLLQDMGQEIVHRESPKEPGGCSRLWIYKDVIHVLKNNTGAEVVEGIMLNIPIQKLEHLSTEAFSKMKNLRLLKIGNEKLPEDFINGTVKLPKDLNRGKVRFLEGLSYLPSELCIIEWHGYHLKCLPTNFQPSKLVELRMHCSGIKQLWKGNIILDELKLIDLSDSQNLIKTLDFSGVPNLKQCLECLPPKINLESLKVFILSGYSRLKKFPEVVGNMSILSELYLNETAIKELPLSVGHFTGLTKLDLRDCKNFSSLPNVCCCLMSLKILILSGCSKINELPENLGNIKGLEELDGDEPIFDMTIPEREIPKWFSHQSVGALVNLQVPSSDLLCNKLKGVTVCAVFVLRQHHPLHQLHSDYEGGFRFMHRLQFYLKANGYGSQPIPSFPFSEEFGKIESYHLYLGSVPSTLFDANGLGQIEIGFETIGPGLEVTKCGARLIFEHDIKDLNQTMRGCSSCSITAYMDDLEDSAKDTKTK